MSKRRMFSVFVCCVASVMLVGCMTPKPAGFLRDYSKMTPSPYIKNAFTYVNPSLDPAKYTKLIIEPVYVYDADKKDMPWISPNGREELGDYFYDQLVTNLSDNYDLVQKGDARTAILRCAITKIKRNIPLFNIHPGSLVLGGGLGKVTIEAEMIDAATGERIAAIIVQGKGKRLKYHKGLTYWAHNKDILKNLAEQFAERTAAVRQ